jgi:hypothetical protein
VNRAEAVDVLEVVVAVWPRVEQTHNAPDVWATIFGAVPADAVLEAVKDFISAGSAFPPSASEVLKLVADRETDVPEWDEALAEIERALERYRPPLRGRVVTSERELYAGPPDDYWSHPVLGIFMQGNVWHEWRAVRERDRRTFLAQQREAYKALRGRASRDLGLLLVSAPRRSTLTGGGLRRLDVAALLPGGVSHDHQIGPPGS